MLIMMTSIVAVSIHATSPLFGVGAGAAVAAAGAAVAVAAVGAGAAAGAGAACVAAGAAALSCASAEPARLAPSASTAHIDIDISNRFIMMLPSKRFRADFAGADANDLQQVEDEDLAVADLAGVRGLLDRLDHALGQSVVDRCLDLHLGQEIDDVLGAAIQLGVALLATEPLHLGDGDALDADRRERFADLVELERLDDCGDHLHVGSFAAQRQKVFFT